MDGKKVSFAAIGLILVFLAGCGSVDPLLPSAKVKFSIYWPERSTTALTKVAGPASALSATVKLTGAAEDGSDFVFTVDRPDGTAAVLQNYLSANRAKVGNRDLWIGFYAEPAGKGELVGEAVNNITLTWDGAGIGEVTTVGTVADVWVYPGQEVTLGVPKRLTCSVNDKNGRLMALLPGAIFWCVVENSDCLKFENTQAVGLKHGSALVQATVDGISSEASSVKIAVVPAAQMIPLLDGAPADAFSLARDLSADGSVVVGCCTAANGKTQAFAWTKGTTPVPLGVLAGYEESYATGVSADGKIITGYCQLADESKKTPFLWTAETGMQKLDAFFDDTDKAWANGISGDGTRIVGACLIDDDIEISFLWEKDKGVSQFWDLLPREMDQHKIELNAISDDGKWIVGAVGYKLSDDEIPQVVCQGAIYHDLGNGTWDLNVTGFTSADSPASYASCVNGSGTVVGGATGMIGAPNFDNPFRWTNETGMAINIPQRMVAYSAAAADALRMAGGGADPGTAFLWDPTNGYQGLYNLLQAQNLLDDLGASPVNIYALSHDGQILVGSGYYTDEDDHSYFRAIYLELP